MVDRVMSDFGLIGDKEPFALDIAEADSELRIVGIEIDFRRAGYIRSILYLPLVPLIPDEPAFPDVEAFRTQ